MINRSLNQVLRLLTEVKRGESVYEVASSERINAIQHAIELIARGDNIVSGNNIRKKSGDGYTVLSADQSRKGGLIEEWPFQVVSRTNPGSGQIEFGVISNSHLFNSEDGDTYEEPNNDWGLLDDDQTTGWFGGGTIDYGTIGDKIYLQIELNPNDQSIVSIDVKFTSVGLSGTDWNQYPDPIEINIDDPSNKYQQFYRQIIAEITDPNEDPRPGKIITIPGADPPNNQIQLTQLLKTNIFMTTAHTTDDANEPQLPLIVNMTWYWPGTDIEGNANEIPPEENLMTPWQYGEPERRIYSFKIVDASDEGGPKVRIYDGEANGELPTGMGDDNFTLDITEWDPGDGEVDIVLQMDYELDGTITNREIVAVKPENYPEDEPGQFIAISLGTVFVEEDPENPGTFKVVEVRNTHLGDIDVELAPLEVYAFQMFDSSNADGNPRVRIFDGDVIDQDGEGHTPSGMGNDDFILGSLNDQDAIFLIIPHDNEWNVIDPITIDHGAVTPDDTDTISYVDIGYVEVILPSGPDESVPQVIPHNTVCGDYAFNPPEEFNHYSFKIVDRSSGDTAKVLILDGDVIDEDGESHTPEDMGTDTCIREVGDGDSIYLAISYNQFDGGIVEPITVHAGAVPDDDPGTQYIELGYVGVTDNQVDNIVNTICGDYHFAREHEENYNFQMFDGSTTGPLIDNPAVRINDGVVFGPNDDGNDPVGMPADGDFTLPVANGDEVWLKIDIDFNSWDVTGVTIENGPSTPPDDDFSIYVTIGNIEIGDDGHVYPHNELCGDYIINPGLGITGDDPITGDDVDFDHVNQLTFQGAVTVEHDGGDPNPSSVDVHIGLDVTGDDDLGNRISIDKIELMNLYGGVDIGINDDDPDVTAMDVEIGLDVTDDNGNSVDKCALMNFIGAATIADSSESDFHAVDVTIGEYVSDNLGNVVENVWGMEFDGATVEETDPGFAIIHVTGEFSVEGDSGFVDGVDHIQFTVSDDPSAGFIDVQDGGDGVAIVVIPVIPPSPGGFVSLVDDNGSTQWQDTETCDCSGSGSGFDGGGA